MKRSILRNSLKSLYADCPEILEAISLISFDQIDYKFYQEIYERMDRDRFHRVDEYLTSDEVLEYCNVIEQATMAVTTQLSQLIELALTPKNIKH